MEVKRHDGTNLTAVHMMCSLPMINDARSRDNTIGELAAFLARAPFHNLDALARHGLAAVLMI